MDMYLIKKNNKDNNIGLLMVSEKGRILVCNMHKEVEAKREILNDERKFTEISDVQKLKEFLHNKRIEAVQIIYRSHTELSFAYKILFEYKDVDFGNIIINNLTFSSDTRDAIEEPDVFPYRKIELCEAVDSKAMTRISYIAAIWNSEIANNLNIINYTNRIAPAYSLVGTLYASLFKAAEILGYTNERFMLNIREEDDKAELHGIKYEAVTGSMIATKSKIVCIPFCSTEKIFIEIRHKVNKLNLDSNRVLEVECEVFKSIIEELLANRIYITAYKANTYGKYQVYNVGNLAAVITDNQGMTKKTLKDKTEYIVSSWLSDIHIRYVADEIQKA